MKNPDNSTGNGNPSQGSALPGDSLVFTNLYIQREQERRAKRKALFNSVCNKAANITGRMALTSFAKVAVGSFVVGAGISAVWGIALAVGTTAVVSAGYTYGTETYTEYKTRKEQGEKVTYWKVLRQSNETRLRRTLTSLFCGVAFGGLGAALMQTDALQWMVEKAGPTVQGWIAAAAGSGAPSVEAVASAAPSADEIIAPVGAVHTAADAVSAPDVAPVADVGVAQAAAAAVTVSSADVAADPLAAGLAHAHIASADSVPDWALKDAAHSVLRLDGVDAADRIAMARALAQEAAERGNAQAVTFLTDLPKVEAAFGLEPTAAPVAAVATVATPTVVAPTVVTPPLADIVLADAADLAPTVAEAAPLSAQFAAEAAVCTVTMQGDVAADVTCAITKPVMDPSDYISFADASDATVRVTTTLDGASVAVATTDMLQETTLSDGTSRLQVLVRHTLGLKR